MTVCGRALRKGVSALHAQEYYMKKGSYGYITSRRKVKIALCALLLAIVLIMYFGARAYFHTNKNLFTIFAALCCLPLGKQIVSAIMFFRARGCSESAHQKIAEHAGSLTAAYDLYLTSYDKNFQLSHAVVSGKTVCALTEDPKCDAKAGQDHIRKMMKNDGYKGCTVKIFTDIDPYLNRLDEMRRSGDETPQRSRKVLDLLCAISL